MTSDGTGIEFDVPSGMVSVAVLLCNGISIAAPDGRDAAVIPSLPEAK